jgi:hypothetical protein
MSGTGAGISPFAWSAPSSPHTPHAAGLPGRTITADEVAEYDGLDLNFVLSSLVDEPSLTYSANDESYLFESMPVDATHTALVHLGGVELFQNSGSLSEEPDSPMAPGSSGDNTAVGGVNNNNNIVTSGYSGRGFLPGTPLSPAAAASFGLGASGGAAGVGAGAGGPSPQTPAAAGIAHQHSQFQIPPVMYRRSLPFTSAFAAAV